MNERKAGLWAAISSYALWGILPLYWKLLKGLEAYEILAHRIIWSFLFMIPLLAAAKKKKLLLDTVHSLFSRSRKGWLIMAAALLISANWCLFIWAVTHDHIVDSSFGYYINPLVSVFLGVILFKERLSLLKWISISIAFIGILGMSLWIGRFPFISLGLALTFGLYGAVKKDLRISPFISITLETLLVLPAALAYATMLGTGGNSHFFVGNSLYTFCLIFAGPVTAVPLLLFSAGANRLPLNVLGFCQYISPSLSLLLGVFLYNEPFTEIQLFGFSSIWTALLLFTIADTRENRAENPPS